jgi:Protein of unknown function (DUF1573)
MANKHNDTAKGRRRPRRAVRRLRNAAIAALAVAGIALVGVFAFGNRQGGASAKQMAGATGTLSAAETFHDFGRISMGNGTVSHRFAVRNDSGAPALVEQLYTSCMCTEGSLLVGTERLGPFGMQGHGYIPRINRLIQPGEAALVEAVFDPNAHGPAGIGRNDRVVTVLMGGRRMLELQFTAYVTP